MIYTELCVLSKCIDLIRELMADMTYILMVRLEIIDKKKTGLQKTIIV